MKILITGGKSLQALKVQRSFINEEVVLGDYGEAPHFPSSKYCFISLGERNDDIVAHNLLTIALDQGVDALMPLYEFEFDQVVKSIILFEEFGIEVLMPEKGQLIK